MRILVTGAAGQLGAAIARDYAGRANVLPVTRKALDIGDAGAVETLIAREHPDVVTNCAAYTDVEAAAGAIFVHYSSDFVFDGLADRPYTEEDEPAPQSVYASSKLLGEWFAAGCPRHYVLRVESLFGGSPRHSSIDRIVDAIRNGEPARVFVDRTVTPSYVHDVADATWRLIGAGAAPGVYHCVNSGVTTWFELAKEIGRQLGVEPNLVPLKVADVTMRARRPQYAALSNAKLARAGIQMPAWQDALRRHLATL